MRVGSPGLYVPFHTKFIQIESLIRAVGIEVSRCLSKSLSLQYSECELPLAVLSFGILDGLVLASCYLAQFCIAFFFSAVHFAFPNTGHMY